MKTQLKFHLQCVTEYNIQDVTFDMCGAVNMLNQIIVKEKEEDKPVREDQLMSGRVSNNDDMCR